ncbi:MAG: MutS-related protein [Peptostreptococcaceae bacterium]
MKEFIMTNLNTMTAYGEYEKKNIKMYKKAKANLLKKELDYIEEVIVRKSSKEDIFNNICYEFCKIKDILGSIKKISNNNVLDDVELFEIKNFAMCSENIKENYEKLNLEIDYINISSLENIVKILDPDNLKLSTFRIYDSYSEKIKSIRECKNKIENEIFKESNLKAIEKLKKQRLAIVVEEEKEELNIRKNITKSLIPFIDNINKNVKSIGKLDLLNAKSEMAIKYNGVKPSTNNQNRIFFKELKNPKLIEILEKQDKNYIPINIDIDKKITLITGANMGGKSVSMNTVILNLFLFQCGFYVFAKEADLCVLDFIYLISDDMQNMGKGLSTFGAEIIKLKEIINLMEIEDGFVALDEFARGTNPSEGRILLKSICNYLKKFNSISLISTHYDEVLGDDIDHYQVVGLKNVDFKALKYKIDLNKKQSVSLLQENMDYRLEKVNKETKVPKDALNICALLGLQDEVINIAKKHYEGDVNE